MASAPNMAARTIPPTFIAECMDTPADFFELVGPEVVLPVPLVLVALRLMGCERSLYVQLDVLHRHLLPMGSHQAVSHVVGSG